MAGPTVSTKGRAKQLESGFTLIEVMIALLLLSVGLLGLEALGVVAVRSVALADRNSRSAVVASLYLEDAIQQIRRNRVPGPCINQLLENGDRVTRLVQMGGSLNVPSRVTVTVTPEPRGSTPRPYTVSSLVFSPGTTTTPGNACPS
jgi:prepilin-type N-terminal cleavage/methylation domain-containing protein